MKRAKTWIQTPIVLIALTGLLSACGGETTRRFASTSNNNINSGGFTALTGPSGITGPTGTTGPSGTDDTTVFPAITESFTTHGVGSTDETYSTSVDTDNVLKVKITAGYAGQLTIPGYGFTANYGCVTYTVSVLGQSVTTQILAVGSGGPSCAGAPTSQTIDFSNRLTPGHSSVTISVKASGYDFYCQGCLSYPWLYNAYPYGSYSCNLYCPLRPFYKNHVATGTLDIQVNGTSL